MAAVNNRSEIVFLYDVKDANPNGDPMDENRPRIDEETEINIVTDVRLKRTIRDYLRDFKGKEIFFREEKDEKQKGNLKTKEDIYEGYGSPEEVLNKCLDIRLFGGTFALKKEKSKTASSERSGEMMEEDVEEQRRSFSLTGPVQFKFGRTPHKVEPIKIKGTTVMPSKEKKGQGTLTEVYISPYSLIIFYGIVNENAAKTTKLTEEDVCDMLDGMWNGTKNLITRSKVGQMPRFLLRIIYSEKCYHIGDLDQKINIGKDKDRKDIRGISEIKVNITELLKALESKKNKIKQITYEVNDDIVFLVNGKDVKGCKIEEELKKIVDDVKRLNLDR